MWLTILLAIIRYGPSIYKIVKAIIEMIQEIGKYKRRVQGRRSANEFKKLKKIELNEALAEYKVTKKQDRLNSMELSLAREMQKIK